MRKRLIVLVGPTASGKTELGIFLAQKLNTEIISADSRQIFREMSIGTAKPSESQLSLTPHHFIGSHSIFDEVSSGIFEHLALKKLSDIFQQSDTALLVGGSGLYVKAVCEGFDKVPPSHPETRHQLEREFMQHGLDSLLDELKKSDPVYYSLVDQSNHRRIIRALEVFRISGAPFSSYQQHKPKKRDFEIIKIGIETDREQLYTQINARVDSMMEAGLLKEAQALFPDRNLNALQTVGYQELFDYLEGKASLSEAVEKIKQNTRNFAKRQLTWFHKDKEIKWFNKDATESIYGYLLKTILKDNLLSD